MGLMKEKWLVAIIQSIRFSGFTCHALDWKNYRPLNSGIIQIVGSYQKTKESHCEHIKHKFTITKMYIFNLMELLSHTN